MKTILFILLGIFLLSCEQQLELQEERFTEPVTGRDINGNIRTCNPPGDLICTTEFSEGSQFALDCENDGFTAVACDCHDYICIDDEYEVGKYFGYNQAGEEASCEGINENTICTLVFTEGDQFGADCERAGYEAYQCGCHEYLCSGNISEE